MLPHIDAIGLGKQGSLFVGNLHVSIWRSVNLMGPHPGRLSVPGVVQVAGRCSPQRCWPSSQNSYCSIAQNAFFAPFTCTSRHLQPPGKMPRAVPYVLLAAGVPLPATRPSDDD